VDFGVSATNAVHKAKLSADEMSAYINHPNPQRKSAYANVYCLQVEDNANFFVRRLYNSGNNASDVSMGTCVTANCDLKICDFGLARGVKEEVDYELTEYVVTRWYRAPEVMCSCQEYDHKIDVWSTGCILAELHGRKPLFPGDDYIKQMNLIFDVLGTPQTADMDFITNDKALEYIKGLKKKPKVPFNKIYRDANPVALDLLDRMLTFNPHKRISVDEALRHPYLKALHNSKTEINCPTPFDFEFEKVEFTRELLQDFMWDEILNFRTELRKRGFKRTKEDSKCVIPQPPTEHVARALALRAQKLQQATK